MIHLHICIFVTVYIVSIRGSQILTSTMTEDCLVRNTNFMIFIECSKKNSIFKSWGDKKDYKVRMSFSLQAKVEGTLYLGPEKDVP